MRYFREYFSYIEESTISIFSTLEEFLLRGQEMIFGLSISSQGIEISLCIVIPEHLAVHRWCYEYRYTPIRYRCPNHLQEKVIRDTVYNFGNSIGCCWYYEDRSRFASYIYMLDMSFCLLYDSSDVISILIAPHRLPDLTGHMFWDSSRSEECIYLSKICSNKGMGSDIMTLYRFLEFVRLLL
jgi:hypothetical protein